MFCLLVTIRTSVFVRARGQHRKNIFGFASDGCRRASITRSRRSFARCWGRSTRVRCSIEARVQHATYHSDRYAAGFVIKTRIVLPGAARQHAKSLAISRSSVVGARGPSLALQSLAFVMRTPCVLYGAGKLNTPRCGRNDCAAAPVTGARTPVSPALTRKPPGAVCARSGLAAPTTIRIATAARTTAGTTRGNPRNTCTPPSADDSDLPRRRCGEPAGRTEERQKAPAARALLRAQCSFGRQPALSKRRRGIGP